MTSSVPEAAVPVYEGWHLVAFEPELREEVTPLDIGGHPLVAVRREGRVRVFDATCPHRGAHLGYGGRLDRDCLICPFHGRRVHLGLDQTGEHRVAEQPCLQMGEALFVRFGDGPELGFTEMISSLAMTHRIVTGFSTPVAVEAEIIVENAFDPEHFAPVHGILRAPAMVPTKGPDGELIVDTELAAPTPDPSAPGSIQVMPIQFYARAYSPNLVVTRLGPSTDSPYYFTGATPAERGCIARIAVAVPARAGAGAAGRGYAEGLVDGAREAFREDIPVWEHLAPGYWDRYDPRDTAVAAFREFIASFRR